MEWRSERLARPGQCDWPWLLFAMSNRGKPKQLPSNKVTDVIEIQLPFVGP